MGKDYTKYRRQDNSIDLIKAWKDGNHAIGITYLELVELYQPIKSRQVAAVALAQADLLKLLYPNNE